MNADDIRNITYMAIAHAAIQLLGGDPTLDLIKKRIAEMVGCEGFPAEISPTHAYEVVLCAAKEEFSQAIERRIAGGE